MGQNGWGRLTVEARHVKKPRGGLTPELMEIS
jgi:hypothetical protein